VSRIILSKANISYKDSALTPPFTKDIKNVSLDVRISLPDKVIFDAEFEIPSQLSTPFKVSGEYRALKKELSLDIKARDLYLRELSPYCKIGFRMPDGKVDAEAALDVNTDRLSARIRMTSLDLIYSLDGIKANLNCALKADVEYNFNKKALIYTGDLDIKNLALSGLEYVDRIDDIRGRAIITESKFLSKNLTCTAAGLPIIAKADLTAGALTLDITSNVELGMLKDCLKNRFKISLPAALKGAGSLGLRLEYKVPVKEMPSINGHLDVSGADIILDYNKIPLKNMNGRFNFTSNQLLWEDLTFKHADADYRSSGALTNFEKPGIEIKLDSNSLSARSLLAVNGNLLTLSRLEGRYEDLEFSVYGDLDTADPSNLMADINGSVKFDLDENKEPFKRFKTFVDNSKPSGRLTAKFALKGNINDMNSCDTDAEVSSGLISLYGFKMENFKMNYIQRSGVMNIVNMRASLYGGTLDASGRIDLVSKDKDYQIKAEVKDLKIEKIKLDTAFKDYNISGSIHSRFGFKGYSSDPSKFSAWGKIEISNGKLWQLNLFQGIGTLIFKKDYSSVVFKEGDCDFSIKDKTISANDISLRSGLVNISGVARIGFDNSVTAFLKTEFTPEGLDASKMALAIERYSTIEVSGTLKEPKVKVRPDLSNVAGDIADGLFQR